jgi:hypothetical protein
MALFSLPRRRARIIDWLRRHFPGTWRYDRHGRMWERDDGLMAHREARFTPRFDGDDDSFTSYLRVGNVTFPLTLVYLNADCHDALCASLVG